LLSVPFSGHFHFPVISADGSFKGRHLNNTLSKIIPGGFHMATDFRRHNEEVARLWRDFEQGTNARVPMILGFNSRYFMFNHITNPENVTYEEYSSDAELMVRMQMRFLEFERMQIYSDKEMGIPEEGWDLSLDFQNYYEAGWMGCPVRFLKDNVPYAEPLLDDDSKRSLFVKGIPDPFSGLMGIGRDHVERINTKLSAYLHCGKPVRSFRPDSFLGTDGPFTLACELRGPTAACIDMLDDPDYFKELMDYITSATIARIKAWRRYLGMPEKTPEFVFADDSIAMLSTMQYNEYVLPFHKRLVRELTVGERPRVSIHLCGDATRHFRTIVQELNAVSFDTGYPVDHPALVRELGPGIRINGGPDVALLHDGTPSQIIARTRSILESVKPYTRRFVLREANNVAPGTPVENLNAMYAACLEFGRYGPSSPDRME
jgi:uroporphyrinogen-III decarboxylase